MGKAEGFSERTAARAIAKAKGKTPKPKPRRSQVEIEGKRFAKFLDVIGDAIPEPSDTVLDRLTEDQNARGIEAIRTAEARLARTRSRMAERYGTDK